MSWNCLFIVVRNTMIEDLVRIGVEPLGPPISAELATGSSFDGVAALPHGGDTVLINTDQTLFTGGALLGQLLQREAVTALFGGASDSYLWRIDGPGFERTWMCQAGETLEDAGLRGPEESGLRILDEDALFGLLAIRTGFGGGDEWMHREAQPITWPPTGPAPKPKKKWFGRERSEDGSSI